MNQAIESPFDTYAGYRAALFEALAQAQRQIVLFDPDLRETGLESADGAEHLRQFLTQASGRECLRMVLRDTDHLAHRCPRLLALLQTHAHKFAIRHDGSDSLQTLRQPFAVFDGSQLVTRFHEDRPRGKHCREDGAACAPYLAQFETLWMNAEPAQSFVPIGL